MASGGVPPASGAGRSRTGAAPGPGRLSPALRERRAAPPAPRRAPAGVADPRRPPLGGRDERPPPPVRGPATPDVAGPRRGDRPGGGSARRAAPAPDARGSRPRATPRRGTA